MIAIRPLARDEFGKVAEFDVTEEGRIAYAWRGGRLVSVLQEWRRPPLTSARVEQIVAAWPAIVARGSVALGAVDGDQLVGVAVLVPHLSETLA